MSEIPSELQRQICETLQADRLLDAVALYREATGSSLLESKQFCERLRTELSAPGGSFDAAWDAAANSSPASADPSLPEEIHDNVMNLLRRGKKLDAVKLYREATGCSLMESKARCEEMLAEHLPSGESQLEANLRVDRSSGCFGSLLVLALMFGSAMMAVVGTAAWLLPRVLP